MSKHIYRARVSFNLITYFGFIRSLIPTARRQCGAKFRSGSNNTDQYPYDVIKVIIELYVSIQAPSLIFTIYCAKLKLT